MYVKDIMSTNICKVDPKDNISTVASIMTEKGVGMIPVCQKNTLVGVVTDRDLVTRAYSKGNVNIPVQEVMTCSPVTVNENQSVLECSRLMAKNKIRRIPVTNGNQLIGIVSLCDIARQKNLNMEASVAISEISER